MAMLFIGYFSQVHVKNVVNVGIDLLFVLLLSWRKQEFGRIEQTNFRFCKNNVNRLSVYSAQLIGSKIVTAPWETGIVVGNSRCSFIPAKLSTARKKVVLPIILKKLHTYRL